MGLRPHDDALEQLRDIEQVSNGRFRVHRQWLADAQNLCVDVSIQCSGFERRRGGLPLRDREKFTLRISDGFPFVPPSVATPHTRFAGFEHVQWMRSVCLYQSTETEWSPLDGMFGLLSRLIDWLVHGARNDFEPEGVPLHPPVAYERSAVSVIPRVDAPRPSVAPWVGFAHLKVIHDARVDIVGWGALEDDVPSGHHVAAATLLTTSMPFEYPGKIADLWALLETRGVAEQYRPLLVAADRNPADTPLYVVVGAPMRGVSGAQELEQHLSVWRIDPVLANKLRALLVGRRDDPDFRQIQDALISEIVKWSLEANVEWATVREARPAVTKRRDDGAAANYFRGRSVAVWGCGALGGHIAELLTRAGVRRLVLRDRSIVAPGVLVRQPFEDRDIGCGKAVNIAERVRRIDPSIVVESHSSDLLGDPLGRDDWTDGADLVIDASASVAVLEKLELRRKTCERRVPIVNVVVDGRAERALVTVAHAEHSGGPGDITRRAKIAACGRRELREFVEAFWPIERPPIFQPEPGCSASTFRGSAADLVGLAATALNFAAKDLSGPTPGSTGTVRFVTQAHVPLGAGSLRQASFAWSPDIVSEDSNSGYQIRLSTGAWAELSAWSARSARVRGRRVETGGVLFGERNDACRVIWVDEIVGPPPDSRASPDGFVCGVEGVVAARDEKSARTRKSVEYIGMWHTHPEAPPIPSSTDRAGMARLTSVAGARTQKALLVILGTSSGRPTSHGTYLFSSKDVERSL